MPGLLANTLHAIESPTPSATCFVAEGFFVTLPVFTLQGPVFTLQGVELAKYAHSFVLVGGSMRIRVSVTRFSARHTLIACREAIYNLLFC